MFQHYNHNHVNLNIFQFMFVLFNRCLLSMISIVMLFNNILRFVKKKNNILRVCCYK